MAILVPKGSWGKKKINKYNARGQYYEGRYFASQRELKRYIILAAMEKSGEIADLETQIRFPFFIEEKKIFSYIADFSYKRSDTGEIVIEDSKGFRTQIYILKKKIIEAHYKIKIVEV